MLTFFEIHAIARFDLLGISVPITVGMVVQWAMMALVFLGVALSHRQTSDVPRGFRNFAEIMSATLRRISTRRAAPTAGHRARRPIPGESLSAAVTAVLLFLVAFWTTEAVTSLPVEKTPVGALVDAVTPIFLALKERTILGPVLERFSGQDIGAEISASIQVREVFGFDLFGFHVPVADVVVVMWGVMAVLFVAAFFLGRRFRPVPKGGQLLAENLVNGLQALCRTVMEPELVDRYVPYVGSIGLFIALCNVSSVFRLPPPAKNPAFPIGLAVLSIASVIVFSIREVGLKGFARSMLYPTGIMLPFKIIDFATKIISLSLRLFGNIFGAFVFMEFINIIMPILLPGLVGLWFDLADGIIQGLVFAYLNALYIGEIVENAHLAEHAEHAVRAGRAERG